MKTFGIIFLCLYSVLTASAVGDTLSLAHCQELAIEHSPLQQQKLYYQSQQQLKGENLRTNFLPQFTLNGQLTYLSNVITFPSIGIPGVAEFPEIPHTQYQLAVNIQQSLYDGGMTKLQQEATRLEQGIKDQQVAVDVFPIKETVSQLFFSILLLDAKQLTLKEAEKELEQRLAEMEARIKYGVVLQNYADGLQKELLKINQQYDQLGTDRKALMNMLGLWIGEKLPSDAVLIPPKTESHKPTSPALNRPELQMFALQDERIQLNQRLVSAKTKPRLSAFTNGGIGRPNPLDYLKTSTTPFYQIGLKFQWSPWNWKKSERDQQLLAVERQLVETKKANFEQQMAILLVQDRERIESLQRQLSKDDRIIELQAQILKRVSTQLENGTITSADYVAEVRSLEQAKLQKEIHLLQLKQSYFNLLTKTGN